jgi:hypothetical protein
MSYFDIQVTDHRFLVSIRGALANQAMVLVGLEEPNQSQSTDQPSAMVLIW